MVKLDETRIFFVVLTNCYRVPPNVHFEVDDVEDEWPPRRPFDLVHIRYMLGSIQDWPKLLRQAWG
jgi:hypothetical protein